MLCVLVPLLLTAAPQIGFSTEINQAIDRGIQRLLAWQNADGSFGGAGHAGGYPMGQSALATYTLLKSGLRRDDPAIERAFRYLRSCDLAKVYSVSCWVLALDAARDPALSPEIRRCAAWLEGCFNTSDDLWGYPDGDPELSNTQFAVLALWTAGRYGYEPDPRLWADAIQGTLDVQNGDGGFGYKLSDRPYSHGTMTTAGITTLAIARDALADDARYGRAVSAADQGLARAWAWVERHFTLTGNPTSDTGLLLDRHKVASDRLYMFHYYYIWGVERIASISGKSEIGGRDWYREGALQLLREEELEGGWSALDTTAFALLFLRRATYSGLEGREQEQSIPRAVTWRYTTEPPPAGWEQPDFDDSAWRTGAGSFGDFRCAYRQDRTSWEGVDIWLRREFRWDRPPAELRLVANHDDGIEIYLNGVAAASSPVFSAKPEEYAVAAAARATLQPDGNVIAVHCHDDGGARTVDVAFTDRGGLAARLGNALVDEPKPWMQRPPAADVPFLRRWLVCGPIADRKHAEFPEQPIQEGALRPLAGQRSRGQMWRATATPGALLDFGAAVKPAEGCFFYAFTYLHVEADTDVVLWLGADDGLSVWLDERLVLSHHVHAHGHGHVHGDAQAHGAARKDELPLPLRLTAGVHALMLRVENHSGPSGLLARLGDLDGRTPRGVRPALEADAPDWPAAARAQPGYFTLDELATQLEPDTRGVQGFDRDADVAALCVAGAADGLPRWDPGSVAKRKGDDASAHPNPGRKGLAVLAPAAAERPATLYRRVLVPELGARLVVSYAPANVPAEEAPGGVRLALWATRDGELVALGEDRATATREPDKNAWRRFETDLAAVAGRDVLLVLEVHADGVGAGAGVVAVDEVVLEVR